MCIRLISALSRLRPYELVAELLYLGRDRVDVAVRLCVEQYVERDAVGVGEGFEIEAVGQTFAPFT